MKEVGFMKKATGVIAAAVAVLTVMPTSEVHAQTSNTIFPEGWDKSVRNRMFMRLGAITVNTKTTSSEAVDVTGPVFTLQDIQRAATYATTVGNANLPPSIKLNSGTWGPILGGLTGIDEFTSGKGLGTPSGIKAKIGEGSTVAMSMGYWLTDDASWLLEAFLLAKPLDVKAYAFGTNMQGKPVGLDGKHIITTKMLPPLAIVSRHFGSPNNFIRPFVGLGATYAIIYDAKTTEAYDTYVGGKTSVSIKNAFGVGPFVGASGKLGEKWHVNLQLGQVKLKTEALLTTRNTVITSESGVTNDFSPSLNDPVDGALALGLNADPQVVTKLSRLVAASKSKSDLGSFTRKQKQDLRSTIVNVSIGYSF